LEQAELALDAETKSFRFDLRPVSVKPADLGRYGTRPWQLNFLQLSCDTLRIWLARGRVPHEELV